MSQTATTTAYRATFILDTRGYQEPVETLVEKLNSVVTSTECTIKKTENLGQKDFVRITNRKFPQGIYILIEFEGPSEAPAIIKEKLRLDRTVNRILVEKI